MSSPQYDVQVIKDQASSGGRAAPVVKTTVIGEMGYVAVAGQELRQVKKTVEEQWDITGESFWSKNNLLFLLECY